MRVKARLQLAELETFFPASTADRIKDSIWGKNTTIILEAFNGKHYWVSYKFKDFHNSYIATKVAKPSKTNPGSFEL
jgi:hypothetical protein